MQQTKKSMDLFDKKLKPYFNYSTIRDDLIKFNGKQNTDLCQLNVTITEAEEFENFRIKFIKDKKFQAQNFLLEEQRAMASFMGLLIGDALGAHTEFQPILDNKFIVKVGFDDIRYYLKYKSQRCSVGRYTDDCSMAKCIAESLLSTDLKPDGRDCRLRYLLWFYYGYCNGSINLTQTFDNAQENKDVSFGLGGNILESFLEFAKTPSEAVFIPKEVQKRNVNGNGCVMRLAPCALVNAKEYLNQKIQNGQSLQNGLKQSLNKTKDLCVWSSLTTHNGVEAEDCSILLGIIIHHCLISNKKGHELKNWVLEQLPYWADEYCQSSAVKFLARSQMEPINNMVIYSAQFNQSPKDRNWNWKVTHLTEANLSPVRLNSKGGREYYGSYVMDCMFIAFHILYVTSSLKTGLFLAASLGGDCDSFGSVVGQIAGAIYGLSEDMMELYLQAPYQYDNYHTPFLAFKLLNRSPVKNMFVGFDYHK